MNPVIMPKATEILHEIQDYLRAQLTPGEMPRIVEKLDLFLRYKAEISNPREVLDHGFVRLVDYMGNDISIVRAARVSYAADWRISSDETSPSDEKLIRYLLNNKHTSPFESVLFTFEIKCPIFVARQWHRHRTWAYNEVSARYTELPEEYYVPNPTMIGKQSEKSKQARDIEATKRSADEWDVEQATLIQDTCDEAFKIYKALLARGVPRELARSVLPVSTYTRFFGTVNLHNLLHFLKLRLHPHAQYEIRVYAEALADIISHIVPVTMGHWTDLRLKEMAND